MEFEFLDQIKAFIEKIIGIVQDLIKKFQEQ